MRVLKKQYLENKAINKEICEQIIDECLEELQDSDFSTENSVDDPNTEVIRSPYVIPLERVGKLPLGIYSPSLTRKSAPLISVPDKTAGCQGLRKFIPSTYVVPPKMDCGLRNSENMINLCYENVVGSDTTSGIPSTPGQTSDRSSPADLEILNNILYGNKNFDNTKNIIPLIQVLDKNFADTLYVVPPLAICIYALDVSSENSETSNKVSDANVVGLTPKVRPPIYTLVEVGRTPIGIYTAHPSGKTVNNVSYEKIARTITDMLIPPPPLSYFANSLNTSAAGPSGNSETLNNVSYESVAGTSSNMGMPSPYAVPSANIFAPSAFGNSNTTNNVLYENVVGTNNNMILHPSSYVAHADLTKLNKTLINVLGKNVSVNKKKPSTISRDDKKSHTKIDLTPKKKVQSPAVAKRFISSRLRSLQTYNANYYLDTLSEMIDSKPPEVKQSPKAPKRVYKMRKWEDFSTPLDESRQKKTSSKAMPYRMPYMPYTTPYTMSYPSSTVD